jgi:hypothetical protein
LIKDAVLISLWTEGADLFGSGSSLNDMLGKAVVVLTSLKKAAHLDISLPENLEKNLRFLNFFETEISRPQVLDNGACSPNVGFQFQRKPCLCILPSKAKSF